LNDSTAALYLAKVSSSRAGNAHTLSSEAPSLTSEA